MKIKIFLLLVLFAAAGTAARADTTSCDTFLYGSSGPCPTNLLVVTTGVCSIPDFPALPNCSPVTLDLNIAVKPALEGPSVQGFVEIVGVTGTFNGIPITNGGTGGVLDAGQGYIPGFGGVSHDPVTFDVLGTSYGIYRDLESGIPLLYDSSGGINWVPWNVTEVFATPEPSALTLLFAGLCVIFLAMLRPSAPQAIH
jgi:hypothetical protein